ncbi:hypothetical protein MKQ68_03575 [Chitinophaga horti]|uniref:Uncharacterized protein n=1 Tax=Chitinophaga horti TaxID=2920382 RepID=A0ABY6J3C6_9BACT|nr:hypothetical protein [Chitinophaga horti]UYQ94170.1 hypothetical protein MKQ68_03575 [Chitinophaga horti]
MNEAFQENTLIWLMVSSVVGGIIGAAIKVLSENVFTHNIIQNRQALDHFKTYSFKLLKSAQALNRRLDFIIKDNANVYRYEDENSKMSLYYVFATYFGWSKIIQEDALDKFQRIPKKMRQFNIAFLNTLKGLSGNQYFTDICKVEEVFARSAVVPNYCFTAIGELMMANIDDNKTLIKSPVLDFTSFCILYKENEEFRNWFIYIDKLLSEIEYSDDNLAWNRLLIFSISLKLLINYLDKRNDLTAPMPDINHLQLLSPKVKIKVLDDLRLFRLKKIDLPKSLSKLA